MKLSSCDVTSCKTFGDRFCFSRKGGIGGGGGCTRRVQTAWPSLGSTLKTPWLARVGHCCPPMHKRVEKTILLPCTALISDGEAFIPVWASSCWLSAVTIASSLMGGCGLSHKRVEDGCKRMAERALVWSLGAENPTELGIW